MLLIDDEADHASINTNNNDKGPTAINLAIRDLLSIFDKSSFVGYTATPFANIFIDPESNEEMKNGKIYKDLFPKDFILSLDPPDNYIGPHRIFTRHADLDCVREIDDNEDIFPIGHRIDFTPKVLPKSLEKAIACFFIAKTIRLLRGHAGKHYSMMVNASRFTRVQDELKGLILERVKSLRNAIGNYGALPEEDALKNVEIRHLYEIWKDDYPHTEFSWWEVQSKLKEAIDPTIVICVNGGPNGERLDYRHTEFPAGRTVIAVGGLGLSRGLTLEGLIVSYFLRNSVMYDTLMQMGRWFGYRDGYEDICRIFMTGQAESWYNHIADATEELREDFRAMEKLKLTPMDFGLRVRSHPTALMVTARNKMRNGEAVPQKTTFRGFLAETIVLSSASDFINDNKQLTNRCIKSLQDDKRTSYSREDKGHLWQNVPLEYIIDYVENFRNHPESYNTFYFPALVEYLNLIKEDHPKGIVYLRTLKSRSEDGILEFGSGLRGSLASRTEKMAIPSKDKISFKKKGRLGESEDEIVGLSEEDILNIKDDYGRNTINPLHYRRAPSKKPLLIIHPLMIKPLDYRVVVGYGISFPGLKDSRTPERLVEYVVNIPYWKKVYGEETLNDEVEDSL